MKFLKWTLIVLAALVAFLFVGGLLLSPNFTVKRSVLVKASPSKVFPLLAEAKRWSEWGIWYKRDPAMKITYAGPPTGPGAAWEWQSQSQGSGKMTITAVEADKRVAYDLFFPDFGTTSTGEVALAAADGGTRVTWTMNGNMGKNPLFRWLTLTADGMVGKDFDEGLALLKALAEMP
jgi:uncharacterized protein YndB with AHSA1/START domain